MAVDLTDQIPLETGPKPPVTNPVPKLDDIDVEVGDLSPLAAERARISLLTAEGVHFRDDSFEQLTRDPATGPVFTAGVALMAAMIDRSQGS